MRFPSIKIATKSLAALVGMIGSLASAAPPPGWKLVFQDEFESIDLDEKKWGTEMAFVGTHGPRYHNEFYLSYTVNEDVILSGGMLRLRTDRRTVEGAEKPCIFEYTQGLVSSHDRFSFTYGYVEIRASYPGGAGMWPCFWLMPQHQSWPPEFDIAEYYGGQRKMHYGLAHGDMFYPKWDSTGDTETNFVGNWHTIALEWTPGRAVWYVDGAIRKIITADYVPATAMYVLLSNSVGGKGSAAGEPDEETIFPNFFDIDYVRIYQPPAVEAAVLVKNEASIQELPAVAADGPKAPPAAPNPTPDETPAPVVFP